jgi:Phage integrase family
VSVPQPTRRDARFLSAEEVDAIANETPVRYRTLVYFLAYTGVRIGEASALRVRNLDLTAGVIRVVESSPEVAGRKITGDTKTRKGRAVHVGPQLRQMLKEPLTKYGRPLDPESLVFTGDRNAQIRQNALNVAHLPACCAKGRNRAAANGPRSPAHRGLADGEVWVYPSRGTGGTGSLSHHNDRPLHTPLFRAMRSRECLGSMGHVDADVLESFESEPRFLVQRDGAGRCVSRWILHDCAPAASSAMAVESAWGGLGDPSPSEPHVATAGRSAKS